MAIPSGIRISSAFDTSSEPFEGTINATLAMVDAVHGDGHLPAIMAYTGDEGQAAASFYRDADTGVPIAIGVDYETAQPHFCFLHELGHFLDHQGIDTPGEYASEYSPLLAPWRQAVQESAPVKFLYRLIDNQRDEHQSTTVDEQSRTNAAFPDRAMLPPVEIDCDYVRYLLRLRELFARSYAQYVTRKYNDAVHTEIDGIIQEELNALRQRSAHRIYPIQWDDEDFMPIAQSLDRLFLDLGWTR